MVRRIEALKTMNREVVVSRAGLMTRLIGTTCAEIERRCPTSGRTPAWSDAGRFLSDAIAGMLTAPITSP